MANILINYQSSSLRHTTQELKEHNLYSWRVLNKDFTKRTAREIHPSFIDNFDIYDDPRPIVAKKIKAYMTEKNIDLIFPLYNDMMLPYLYDKVGITKKQASILSNKEYYSKLARQLHIPVPKTYSNVHDATFPIIAKPVNGTGSIGIKVLTDFNDFAQFVSGKDYQHNDLEKYYIFQEFLQGKTVSCAGRIVDGEMLYDISYEIESSALPYRAETGFIFSADMDHDSTLQYYIEKLCKGLGLDNCCWMADFVYSDGEYFLVDFSARLSTSAQTLIKYSADVDYNKIVVDSLLNKDKTKIDCKKSVVYRHFNLPMAEYTAEVDKSLVDEIQLPAYTTYQNRIDMLVQYNGYAITSAETLPQAEHKHKTVVQTLIKSLNVI